MLKEKLTNGEKMFLSRKRDGATQTHAAKKAKVAVTVYRKWEKDEEKGGPKIALKDVQDHEKCLILRRRAGLTIAQLAEKVGCCRWWLHQMEHGYQDYDQLYDYWDSKKKPVKK